MSVPRWLQGARLAPSAHNTQPWQFAAQPDGRVAVGWDSERALPIADPTSRDLYLGLGAAIESACLRALADGTPLQFQPAPASTAAPLQFQPAPSVAGAPRPRELVPPAWRQGERTIGWLAPISESGPPDSTDLVLAAVLARRQTARVPHLPSPVPADLQANLVAEAQRSGCLLQIVTGRQPIARLAKLAGQATALLFADDAVHAELWRWLRLDPADPAYKRDGLTADCLELDGPTLWLARQLMPPARMRWLSRLRLHHLLAYDTANVACQSAAICLLSSPSADRASLVATGRVLQRLWLTAAAAGLTTHPLSALLDRPETAGAAAALFQGHGTPVGARLASPAAQPASPAAIFRLGYTSPAARSPRLPLDELWRDGPTAQD